MVEKDYTLEENVAAFNEVLPGLLEDILNKGKFAVGRKGERFTCWDTYGDALKYGYNTYGLKSFVVQEVLPTPRIQIITRELDTTPVRVR